jgi:hypothetical protein
MNRRLAGLVAVALGLVLSTGLSPASSKELQIVKTSIEGTSVVLVIENTTKDLVTGRCLGSFNNGETIQSDEASLVKVEPGIHEVRLDFPEKGSFAIQAIQDGPDGFPPARGIVIVGTITDDINPF